MKRGVQRQRQRQPAEEVPLRNSAAMKIPGSLGFCSAHTMINRERAKQGLKSLTRSTFLDCLCQMHAQFMAQEQRLFHSVDSTNDLKEIVNSQHCAENVQQGISVRGMHKQAMKSGKSASANILSPNFEAFGVATAQAADGQLYMAQIFRGSKKEQQRRI